MRADLPTNKPAEEQKEPEKWQNNNNARNDLGGLGWPCPERRPLPTCGCRTGMRSEHETEQTPDVTFLKYRTANHGATTFIHCWHTLLQSLRLFLFTCSVAPSCGSFPLGSAAVGGPGGAGVTSCTGRQQGTWSGEARLEPGPCCAAAGRH